MQLEVGKYYLDNWDKICHIKYEASFPGAKFCIENYNIYSDGGSAIYFHREDGSVNLVYSSKKFHERNLKQELLPEEYPELYI